MKLSAWYKSWHAKTENIYRTKHSTLNSRRTSIWMFSLLKVPLMHPPFTEVLAETGVMGSKLSIKNIKYKDCLIFNIGISVLVRHLYIEMAPGLFPGVTRISCSLFLYLGAHFQLPKHARIYNFIHWWQKFRLSIEDEWCIYIYIYICVCVSVYYTTP